MDESRIKRLLIILAISIIAILLIKVALTKTYSQLNNASVAKKQAAEAAKASTQEQIPAASEIAETPAALSVGEVTTQNSPPASAVSETR
jgi:hypothetical protein